MGKGQEGVEAGERADARPGDGTRPPVGGVGRSRCRALGLLPIAALVGTLLSGCHTTTQGDPHHAALLPPGLLSAGLALHHLNIASGLYVRRSEVDDDLVMSRQEALAGLGTRGDSLTWLGHSTVLLRLGGVTILTDPVFPVGFSLESPLPHRHVLAPIGLDDLPPIDVVLLSHGDYDHLHTPTLKALATRFPKARIVLPNGLESYGEKAGFTTVEHPLHGETVVAGRAMLTAFPAVHGTRRNLLAKLDGDAYVWDIRLAGRSALFVGDSAHGPVFGEIGRKRGPYDLALVPIGAFEPSPLVADMHSTPEDAALILAELRATLGIGIHWGTFALSPEPLRDPADRFLAASDGNHRARVLRIGETLAITGRGN
ncbi:MAG: MBL fold metallo-hydrolase [Arenimonas sp.]|nr:MBL fold metallo-hydrolase [Rhizobium sp.]MBW8446577.1 MBL fold metallo-hydrolase [Arenimonas sp.]